jgi:Tol biopolymer transport system component
MASASIAIASLEDGSTTRLDLPGIHPVGLIDGTLVYVTFQGALMAVPIDLRNKRTRGAPVQLLSGIMFNRTTAIARVGLSRTGTLFYQEAAAASRVVFVNKGQRTPLSLDEAEYGFPRLSPDARQVALSLISADRRDIWLFDLSSGTRTRFTNEGTINERPEWTPDGRRVLFRSDRSQRNSIWWRPVDQSAPATPLLASNHSEYFEGVISPDSRYIAYQLDTAGADVYYRALSGDTTPVAVANSSAIESMPRISPNGRLIAFITDESGRNEVVVQPFPGPGGRVQVSADGGVEPLWSRDGRRLFYRTGQHVMAATLELNGASALVSRRDTLFEDRYAYAINPHANYDVMPDGERFIFLEPVRDGNLVVVTNWASLVRAQVRPDG